MCDFCSTPLTNEDEIPITPVLTSAERPIARLSLAPTVKATTLKPATKVRVWELVRPDGSSVIAVSGELPQALEANERLGDSPYRWREYRG